MAVEKEAVNWDAISVFLVVAGFVGTWLYQAFGIGKVTGKMRADITRQDEKISSLEITHEKEMAAVRKMFTTMNGEPRLVSFAALAHIKTDCQNHILSEIAHIRDDVGGMRKDFKSYSDKVDAALQGQAVLMADRDKGKCGGL
jgi:hypothetical protein